MNGISARLMEILLKIFKHGTKQDCELGLCLVRWPIFGGHETAEELDSRIDTFHRCLLQVVER